MNKLLEMIKQVSTDNISTVLQAVIKRYEELLPGWDIAVFTIEKRGDRTEQINGIIRLLESAKEDV